jgi:hypothetical protein
MAVRSQPPGSSTVHPAVGPDDVLARLSGPSAVVLDDLNPTGEFLARFALELTGSDPVRWIDLRPGSSWTFVVFSVGPDGTHPCSVGGAGHPAVPVGGWYEGSSLVSLPTVVRWPADASGPRIAGTDDDCGIPGVFVFQAVLRTTRADFVRLVPGLDLALDILGSPNLPCATSGLLALDPGVCGWSREAIWGGVLQHGQARYIVSNPWPVCVVRRGETCERSHTSAPTPSALPMQEPPTLP